MDSNANLTFKSITDSLLLNFIDNLLITKENCFRLSVLYNGETSIESHITFNTKVLICA